MITNRTKLQLLIFALITMIGVSYVGARYARLDRWFIDDTYTVVVHLERSGGIFVSSEVTYRGVGVGRVADMKLRDGGGVDVHLDVDKDYDEIPADTVALVGNRSAVGEQYVELQPRIDDGPYLEEGSEIDPADTETPIATEKLLADISNTVSSVDRDALRTTIGEFGLAFAGAGPDLQRIIDTTTSFIETADANFDVTTALIRDSNTVLQTQLDSESSLRTFARDMGLFSEALAASDPDLRQVMTRGIRTSRQVRTFLEENEEQISRMLNHMITTGEVMSAHIPGIEQILIAYPYVVEGGMTVVAKSPDTGLYDAHFGMIMSDTHPCQSGYESTERRGPHNGEHWPMNEEARCTASPSEANPRGAQNSPDKTGYNRAAPGYDAPVVGTYDPETGTFRWGEEPGPNEVSRQPGTVAAGSLGEESWQWLYLQPWAHAQD